MFTVYKIFQHLDNMYLRNRKTSLFLEGAKIFRDKYVEQIIDELNIATFSMLTRYKSGIKINEEEVAFVIHQIGLCGFFDSLTAITLSKPSKTENPVFVLDSISPYETIYFKENFISNLVRYIEHQYREKSKDLLKMSTPEYVEEALRYIIRTKDILNQWKKK